MFTVPFLKDVAERVIASAAGGALAVATVSGFDFSADNLVKLALGAGVAALVSLLKAFAASKVGDPATASLVK